MPAVRNQNRLACSLTGKLTLVGWDVTFGTAKRPGLMGTSPSLPHCTGEILAKCYICSLKGGN